MNAKELLKEYPDTTVYFECSDSECFLTEEQVRAHCAHFKRKYEKVEVKAEVQTEQPKDFIDEVIDRIKERFESEDAARKTPEPEPDNEEDNDGIDPVGDANPIVGPIGVTGTPGPIGSSGVSPESDLGKKGKAKNEDKKA